jgi:hypothetical protein
MEILNMLDLLPSTRRNTVAKAINPQSAEITEESKNRSSIVSQMSKSQLTLVEAMDNDTPQMK